MSIVAPAPWTPAGRLYDACRRSGFNRPKLAQMVQLWIDGMSAARMAAWCKVSKNDATRIARVAAAIGVVRTPCACGRPAGHKGWCSAMPHRDVWANGKRKRELTLAGPPWWRAIHAATVHITLIDLRNEVRQQLALAYLTSKLDTEHLRAEAGRLASHLAGDIARSVSLNSTVRPDGSSWLNSIPDERSLPDEYSHCPFCGDEPLTLVRVHGHQQCDSCGAVVISCCEP